MSTCRECGGDGIDPTVSPRAASIARAVFHLASADGKLDWRGNVKDHLERSQMSTAGPLAYVLTDAELKLADGYRISQGDMPDDSLACEHCEGMGKCQHRCCRRLVLETYPRGAPRRSYQP